jgi:hypothetical protein
MVWSRKRWLRSFLMGLGILAAPLGASTVLAQAPIDPFRPFNSQYDPYRTPIGPASPDGGQSAPMALSGVRGANQFQDYLTELQGAGRDGSQRSGIGVPYYRSAIDPRFDKNGDREYRPNRRADATFEQKQALITEKYFAYFTEKDPKKRAELLRNFNRARSQVTRALSARGARSEQLLRAVDPGQSDAVTRNDLDSRPSVATSRRVDTLRKPAESKPRASSAAPTSSNPDSDQARDGRAPSIPPAPPLFPGLGTRGSRPRRSPSDILNRSLRLNTDDATTPGTLTRTPGRSTTGTNGRTPSSTTPVVPPSDN